MSQQCPFCAAPLPEQKGAAATVRVCPQCGSEFSADLVSPSLEPDPAAPADEDELLVDFSVADEATTAERPERSVVDEQAIEWLDESPLEMELIDEEEGAATSADASDLKLETEPAETADEFFGLDDEGAAPVVAGGPNTAGSRGVQSPDLPADVAAASEGPADTRPPFDPDDTPYELDLPGRKPRKSILARVVGGVVLAAGLLLGAAILQLLCWWILRLDPLNAAFMVPKSISFVVPHSLTEEGRREAMSKAVRSDSPADYAEEDDEGFETAASAALEDDAGALDGATTLPEDSLADDAPKETIPQDSLADIEAPTGEMADTPVAVEEPTAPASEMAPATEVEPPLPDDTSFAAAEPAGDDLAPATEGATEESAAPADSADDDLFGFEEPDAAGPADAMVEAPSPAPMITNVPVFRAADLRSATAAAAEATRRLNDAKLNRVPTEELKEIARDFYRSLCDLGEMGTLVEPGTADRELAEARDLLENLAQDASKLRMIGTSSVGWLAGRLGDGIIVSGTVEGSQAVGDFQEITVRPTGKDVTMVVVALRDAEMASEVLTVGSHFLLAGHVVRDPAVQLPEYLATAGEVIWTNHLVITAP